MTHVILVLGALTMEGIAARIGVGAIFGLITYFFAKRWNLETLGGIGLVLCVAGGAFGGLVGALAIMIVVLVCADYARREAEKARRAIKIFKVGDTDFGVHVASSHHALDRNGAKPVLSIEAHGDPQKTPTGNWPAGTKPSIVIANAPVQVHENMFEARFPANTSAAAGIMLQCAGAHAVEDLCVRLHADGRAEVFGLIVIDGDRKPLRINWCPPAATPPDKSPPSE